MAYILRFFSENNGNRTGLSAIVLAFCLLLTALPLTAQITTSSISGNVSDGKNPIPNAVVTVVHGPTGTNYYVFSNERGNFIINNVLVGGPYTVRVERLNFQTAIVHDVVAPIGETVVVNVELARTSQRIEEITIFGDGEKSSMNINRSGAGILINSSEIVTVPSVSRSLYDMLRYTPQGLITEGGAAFGGANYRGSFVTVDGASFNNAFGIGSSLPAGGTPISLEAIDQVSVNLTPYNVRHSGFLGGAINMVTKHGTNKWHGSVYNYFTNDDLQGKRVGDAWLAVPFTLNNTIGVTLEGPIVKDKLFFFVNGEYVVSHDAGSDVLSRMDESQPYGGSTGYNRPTTGQMDAIHQFLVDKYGYDPGRYEYYTVRTPDFRAFARLDWRINDYNLFNIRLSHTHVSTPYPAASSFNPLGGSNITLLSNGELYTVNRDNAGRNSQYSMPFESARYCQKQNFTSLAAELNSHVLNGQGNNMARITWSLQNEPRTFVGGYFPTVDILEPYTAADGSTQLALFTTFGPDPFTYNNLRRVHTITLTDEFNYKKGIHNIMTGAQFEWNRIVNGFMQGGAGWYVYDSWQSFLADANGEEGAGPSLFMITHANTDNPTEQVFPTFTHSQISIYAQDDMEFSKFFKLTVGLRLEAPFVRFRYNNLNVEFDQIAAANPNSSFAGLSTDDVPNVDYHISPRVGFNWDITHKRKVILRGGTGLFTGRIPNVWLVSAAGNSNCLQYQYIANLETGQDVVNFDPELSNIINSVHHGQEYNRTSLPAPTNATILAKDLRMPTSWKSSLALDFVIPGDIKATLEAVYSFNFNEVYAKVLGYKEDGTISLPGEPNTRTNYASEGITNSDGSYMSGYYLYNEKKLHGQYVSLTAQLTKEFRFGLNLMAAYTLSNARTISDGISDQVSSLANTASVNGSNSPELGLTGYVAPHRVIASIGYNIKEGPHTATRLGLFYEGLNMGIYNVNYRSHRSYLIDYASGMNSLQLMYIPTSEELAAMPFVSEENRNAFEEFISNDNYLSKHRGEYSIRNGGKAPWVNRINFKVEQEIYFNIKGHKHTIDVGVDFNNLGNLFCSKWGAYKVLDNEVVLKYDNQNGKYTFTPSTWSLYNNLSNTWQILLHLKYAF